MKQDNKKEEGLKPGVETQKEKVTSKPEDKEDTGAKGGKKIEVSEDILRQLINSNKILQDKVDRLDSNAVAQSPGLQVRRKVREFDYTLRKWGDKVVLGFENMGTEKRPIHVYKVYNKETRKEEEFVNLVLHNEKETVKKIDYITFLRDAEKIKARMISKEEHEDIKEYGMIPKKDMAENGYGMFETMVLVPVEVVTKTYTMTLQLPEDEGGDQVKVNSQWLNL